MANVAVNGRWTPREKGLFLEGFSKFGRDWRAVSEVVGTRTPTQCRSHAQKVLSAGGAPKRRRSPSPTALPELALLDSDTESLLSIPESAGPEGSSVTELIRRTAAREVFTRMWGTPPPREVEDGMVRYLELRRLCYVPAHGRIVVSLAQIAPPV